MSKTIELTQGQVAIVDDEDYEYLSQWNWQAAWQKNIKSFYAVRVGGIGEKVTIEVFGEFAKINFCNGNR